MGRGSINACGYIHGAFANQNGAPGAPGPNGATWGGGVKVVDSAGYNNSVASASCVAQMGH